MAKILTLTFNPTVDAASETDHVRSTRKIRTFDESFHPGGGGINVARVIHLLGGDVTALYAAGGVMGKVLEHLLTEQEIPCDIIKIEGNTRINNVVHERSTGLEYRFIAQGPVLTRKDWQAVIKRCHEMEWEWLIVSGSLPRGVPVEVYDDLIDLAHSRNAQCVLDTSGESLRHVFQKGGLTLIKPSQGEFEACCGKAFQTVHEIAEEAQTFVKKGISKIIAVTLGHQGAVLATDERILYLSSPPIRVLSASGAGDSFVAGMVHALTIGRDVEEAFRLATACGTAAVAEKGTGLCRLKNIKHLYKELSGEPADFLSVPLEPEP